VKIQKRQGSRSSISGHTCPVYEQQIEEICESVILSDGTTSRTGKRFWSGILLLYPFLLALFPVVSLYANNMHEVPFSQAYRTIFLALLTVFILYAGIYLINKDIHKAAAISALAAIIFFSYGHLYDALKEVAVANLVIGRHRFLLPALALLFFSLVYLLVKLLRNWTFLTQTIAFMAVILVSLPVFTIALYQYRSISRWEPAGLQDQETQGFKYAGSAPAPDIYYIIFDAYARGDVMQEFIGLDNAELLKHLEEQGFYIASGSNANYLWTSLSLSSSLNMTFVQDLGLELKRGTYPAIFVEPIRHSRVRALLEELGYTIVSTRSGYVPTEITDADIFLQPETAELEKLRKPLTLNAFEGMMLHSTAFRVIEDFEQSMNLHLIDVEGQREYKTVGWRLNQYSHDMLREIILSQLDDFNSIPAIPGPKFVFAHVISPHGPYLFQANGEPLPADDPFTLLQAGTKGEREIELYKGQATYMTSRIRLLVDEILAQSIDPPIIILQADHGPSEGGDWNSPDEGGVWRRSAIFNAYYMPDRCGEMLYPSITPVNSFRVVFNCAFQAEFPLLEDTVYYSGFPRETGYDFMTINDRIR
jgi:hypothetical protein